ncbi:hypothetical protein JCM8097_004915 [Rhodosporidiobolus ruineniae]
MVHASATNDALALASSTDDGAEPPDSGYSPHSHSHQHAAFAHDQPQLSAGALHQRLLHLNPDLAHEATSPREQGLRSSSAPDLARPHGLNDAPSPACLDDEQRDKVHRTNSVVVPTRSHSSRAPSASRPAAIGVEPADDAQGLGGVPLHAGLATPVNGTSTAGAGPPRPPLLSKALLEPKKKLGKNPSFSRCVVNTLKYSWLNVLFLLVPVAWAMDLSHQSPVIVFVFSLLAIIPCAALLGFATEELAIRVGDALGGLLNATFGNAVELIISILALVKGELDIVRSSMLGSILSNCLLVLGGCFFVGGIRFFEQPYSTRAAQLNINLLGITVLAIVVPVAFHYFAVGENSGRVAMADDSVLRLSRGIAFILLFVYICYLVFQLWTHSYLYVPAPPRDPRAPLPTSTAALLLYADGPQPPTEGRVFRIPSWGSSTSSASSTRSSMRSVTLGVTRTRSRASSRGQADLEEGALGEPQQYDTGAQVLHLSDADAEVLAGESPEHQRIDIEKGFPHIAGGKGAAAGTVSHEVEHEEPKLSPWFAFGLLAVVTALTGVTAEFLVSSIDGLTQTGNVSREFVAFILLPVVGNAAEHVTAITVAHKNKLDLSIAIAVGSSLQIGLFVIPILVLLGWCIGQPLDFLFDPYETVLIFLSIMSVNLAISDGRTQWLEGVALMSSYVVIALTVWFWPGAEALAV